MTIETEIAAVSGDVNAAVLSERIRISAILESAEGKRNPGMAQKLALYSSLDVDTARDILSAAPASNPFLAALELQGPIDGFSIGSGASVATFDGADTAKAARLKEIAESTAAFNTSRGFVPKRV